MLLKALIRLFLHFKLINYCGYVFLGLMLIFILINIIKHHTSVHLVLWIE